MKVFESINDIHTAVLNLRERGFSIGFVPTMGALHDGHLSLLRTSIAGNDISISSIFVNPTQFNNKLDLEKYPRTFEEDCKKLEQAGCDIVFAPSADEMYPEEVKTTYDFGQLEQLMEGEHRPGHFNGVAVVVKKLFDICLPHKSYFGEKDFQQLMIIRDLVKKEKMDIEIIGCPIIREADGLAMSSRNTRLSQHERPIAPEIYKTLIRMKEQAVSTSFEQLIEEAQSNLESLPEIKIEYIQIVDDETLLPVRTWDEARNIRVFIAMFLGDVRLIDNMKLD